MIYEAVALSEDLMAALLQDIETAFVGEVNDFLLMREVQGFARCWTSIRCPGLGITEYRAVQTSPTSVGILMCRPAKEQEPVQVGSILRYISDSVRVRDICSWCAVLYDNYDIETVLSAVFKWQTVHETQHLQPRIGYTKQCMPCLYFVQ